MSTEKKGNNSVMREISIDKLVVNCSVGKFITHFI
jgi:ribosomal protein L5